MRGLEALLGLLDAADGDGGIQEHHALDDEGGAAFQLGVLGHHHVDVLEDAGELGCVWEEEEEEKGGGEREAGKSEKLRMHMTGEGENNEGKPANLKTLFNAVMHI